jgi:hypothetical protein
MTKVIVPLSAREQTIRHTSNRGLKHVSIIACVSAGGESLTPYFVTSQDSPAVRQARNKRSVRRGTDFVLRHRATPYINAEIFDEYIRSVLLPNLNELQSLEGFPDEDAVLLIGDYPSHVGEHMLGLLRDAQVRVITWPPHTTKIFEELDLSLSGVLKRKAHYNLPFDNDEGTAAFVFKSYRVFKETMVEVNIWGAFREAEFQFEISVEPYRLLLHAEILRATPAFREMWSLDVPLEKLSVRRRNARFGWINRPE